MTAAAALDFGCADIIPCVRDVPQPSLPNRKGDTALHIAAACGCVGSVNVLLSYGADVNALGYSGDTPLQRALSACALVGDPGPELVDTVKRLRAAQQGSRDGGSGMSTPTRAGLGGAGTRTPRGDGGGSSPWRLWNMLSPGKTAAAAADDATSPPHSEPVMRAPAADGDGGAAAAGQGGGDGGGGGGGGGGLFKKLARKVFSSRQAHLGGDSTTYVYDDALKQWVEKVCAALRVSIRVRLRDGIAVVCLQDSKGKVSGRVSFPPPMYPRPQTRAAEPTIDTALDGPTLATSWSPGGSTPSTTGFPSYPNTPSQPPTPGTGTGFMGFPPPSGEVPASDVSTASGRSSPERGDDARPPSTGASMFMNPSAATSAAPPRSARTSLPKRHYVDALNMRR